MREEKIRVKISPEGDVTIDVEGVKGKACLDFTKELEEDLGIVTARESKKEMHERPARVTTKNVSRIHRRGR